MCRSRKFCQGALIFILVINIFHRGMYGPPPRSPIASQGGSVPVFLRKHIATCDFPGGSVAPAPLSGSAHVLISLWPIRQGDSFCQQSVLVVGYIS